VNRKRQRNFLLALSFFLLLAAYLTSYFGVQSELGRIPPEKLRDITDKEWVGFVWIERSLILALLSLLSALVGLLFWYSDRHG
jgi:hypothetical protein